MSQPPNGPSSPSSPPSQSNRPNPSAGGAGEQAPPSFNRRGAVDLSARAAASAAPGGASGRGSARGSYVLDVSEQDFQNEVLQKSMTVPVVVEFYSTAAQQNVPASRDLAALANSYDGRFLLARVDVASSPQIARSVGIQAIPTAVAVIRGQLAPLWQGQPEQGQLKQYLDQVLQIAVANGVAGRAQPVAGAEDEGGDEVDERYAAAEDALTSGDLDAARSAYEQILADRPDDPRAQQGIKGLALVQRVQELPADITAQADAAPGDVDLAVQAADAELAQGLVAEGFDRLLAVVRLSPGDGRETARKRLLELFDLLGNADPDVAAARRKLTTALF